MPTSTTCVMAGETCYSIGGVAKRKEQHVLTTKRHRKQGKLPPPDFTYNGREWWRESTLDRHDRAVMETKAPRETGRQRVRRKQPAMTIA